MRRLILQDTPPSPSDTGDQTLHPYSSDWAQAEQALLVMDLDLKNDSVRVVGNIANDTRARALHQLRMDEDSLNVQRYQRGDHPVVDHSLRLFNRPEEPHRRLSVLVPGLSISELRQDVTQADIVHNKRDPRTLPSTLVRALTINGKGGELDWRNGAPAPCAWFFVENYLAKNPQTADIYSLKGRRGRREYGNYKEWYLPAEFRESQADLFNRWLVTHNSSASQYPTHRPITERYYLQLQRAGLDGSSKDDLGKQFFGTYTYQLLEGRRRQIEEAHRRKRR